MAVQRIRGQEVKVYVQGPNGTVASLADIRSFSLTPKFKKLEEQYLGETTMRYDELFDGVDFDMELHIEDPGVFDFVSLIRARAVDRTSKTVVNITSQIQYAGGPLKNVILQDCFFENMPLNVGSRSDYVTIKLTGSCSNFEVI